MFKAIVHIDTDVRRVAGLCVHAALVALAVACSEAGASLPTAPTSIVAVPDDGRVVLAWSLGDDGGRPIENHAYSLDDGATWLAFDPPRTGGFGSVEGLTNGVIHPLRLRAITSAGAGAASESLSVVAAVRSYLQTIDGPGSTNVSDAVGLADGSVIVVGNAIGAVSFGDAATLPEVPGRRSFVARIDANGEWAWVRTISSGEFVWSYGVVALGDTAVVAGAFKGLTTFEGHGSLDAPLDSAFVARIDASGAWQWVSVATGGTSGGIEGVAATADLEDGVVIVTNVSGAVTFGAAGTITAGSSIVGAVARVADDGAWSWAVAAGGEAETYFGGVAVTPDGEVVVAGFADGVDAIAGVAPIEHTASWGVLVAGLRPGGEWSWALGAGGAGDDRGLALTVDADGTVYVVGRIGGSAMFGSLPDVLVLGSSDGFIAAVDTDRSWAWVTPLGATNQAIVSDVLVTTSGALTVAGTFRGNAAFGGADLEPSGARAGFVASVGAGGVWGTRELVDSDGTIDTLSLGRAAGDGIVIAGSFRGSMTVSGYARTSTLPDRSDGFVLRRGTITF